MPEDCEKGCELSHVDGGIEIGTVYRRSAAGTILPELIEAMRAIGYVAPGIQISTTRRYYPTPLGIDYLHHYRHRLRTWLQRNYLSAVVAGATVVATIINVIAFLTNS